MEEHRWLLVYVAGAYPGDVGKNVEEAEQACVALIRNGFHVINSYDMRCMNPPQITDGDFTEMDMNILSRCDAIYVLNNCRGLEVTQAEMEYAEKLGISIILEEVHPFGDFVYDDVQNDDFSPEMHPLKDLRKVMEQMRGWQ